MDGMLQPPAATALEAAGSAAALLISLGVALGVFARHPRDVRARTFLAASLAGVVPYLATPLVWYRGASAFNPAVILVLALSFSIGSLALFHFTQVFPAPRPWIRAHRPWLPAGYVVLPPVAACAAWLVTALLTDPAHAPAADSPVLLSALLLVIVVPAVFVAGIVLPFAGLLSLYKSWLESRTAGAQGARETTFWMLFSQMAGGVLTILVLPLLRTVGATAGWAAGLSVLALGFGLLMPIAFGVADWKYGLLSGG